MRAARLLAAGSAGLLLLAACGEDAPDAGSPVTAPPASAQPTAPATAAPTTPPSTAPPTTAAPSLADALPGRTFLSTAVEGFTLVEGTRIELRFDADQLGAHAGCNHLSGAWSADGDVLVVDSLVQTEMACEPSTLMDQDTWLAAVLTSRPTLALDGDTLTVTAEGATVTLVDAATADPDRPLEGTDWTVDSLVSGDVVSSVPAGVRTPTLRFQDGRLQVDTGCNRGGADYTLDGDTVTFGPLALTRMACTAEGAAQTEQHIATVLTGSAQVTIERRTLTLTNGTAGLVALAPDEGADGGGTGDAGGGLVGPAWRLESITTGDTTEPVPTLERWPTLTFDETTVSVDTGCNQGSGSYAVEGDRMTFGPITMTLRLCEDPAGSVETAILGVLGDAATFALGPDGALTLTSGDTTLRYTR
jgi:heat shock protein HslJ